MEFVYLIKRSRSASTVACDVIRVGAVLPTTRSPSTKQTRIGRHSGLNTIGQLARRLCPGKCIGDLASMALKKLGDAAIDFGVMARQFHGRGHQQASARPLAPLVRST